MWTKYRKIQTRKNSVFGHFLHNECYRSLLLLPIYGKIFEILIFNVQIFVQNLVLFKQSAFEPGDSCINQLISITHKMFE